MWLRPRTELLPSDSRWWEFNDDPMSSTLAVALGAIGFLYVTAGLKGLVRAPSVAHLGLLVTFVILRSAFLSTLENPEPRYTLECYPVVILLASAVYITVIRAPAASLPKLVAALQKSGTPQPPWR